MPKANIILSQDGSHTIHSEQFNVSYHSKYGAIQETQTVFLDAGLKHVLELTESKTVSILEMGFGTGLNALMTLLSKYAEGITIDYQTIEAYPISLSDAAELNYPSVLNVSGKEKQSFLDMHAAANSKKVQLTDIFSFTKYITLLEDFTSDEKFDIIYYDAFAPTSQEHLWTDEMMKKIASITAENGVLVTYCAKGSFKRALKSAGFTVEGIPGPIGKREMTRATLLI